MNVIVVGGGGFLGSAVTKYFGGRQDSVRVMSSRLKGREQWAADFQALVQAHLPDLVMCVGASQLHGDDAASLRDLIDANIWMPATVLSTLRQLASECVVILFGSAWECDALGRRNPFNAYGASKTGVRSFCDHFANSGLRCATLTLFDTYGPYDPRRKIVNLMIDAALTRERLEMTPGGQEIDLTYIDDVVSSISRVYQVLVSDESGRHEEYTVRSNAPVTIRELGCMIAEKVGRDWADIYSFGARPYRPGERMRVGEVVRAVPDWKPLVCLSDGIDRTIKARQRAEV